MPRLVLHVGAKKAGSTALQEHVAANRNELAGHGVRAFEFRRPNHAELAVAFASSITRLSLSYGVRDDADRAELRRRLPALMGDLGRSPTWFATSEHIGALVREPDEIAALAEFLHGLFDDVLVLVVLRRGDYWTPSAWAEGIKSGGTRPFDAAFVERRAPDLDHRALLARWAAAFGADRVRAIPFLERDKADPAALPTRLLAAAGVPPDAVARWPVPPQRHNESISSYGVELLRRVNIERQDSPTRRLPDRYRTMPIVRANWPGPAPALTVEAADALHRRGWVHSDTGSTTAAYGDGWAEWTAQPDAPVAALPEVCDRDVARLVRILRARGLLPHTPWSRVEIAARRAARRLLRR